MNQIRRAIATVAIGAHEDLLAISIYNLTEFAEKHGYVLKICTHSLDSSRPSAWTKLLFIIDLMNQYDEIFWIDADAIILETSRDIKAEIDSKSELSWVYHEYGNQRHPNSGVMYIKVNDNTKKLFHKANLQHDLENHPWWDQAALMRVMGIQTLDSNIGRMPKNEVMEIKEQRLSLEWNSIRQNSSHSPIIRHFAGEPFWIRKFLMAEYANPEIGASLVLENMVLEFMKLESENNKVNYPSVSSNADSNNYTSAHLLLKRIVRQFRKRLRIK